MPDSRFHLSISRRNILGDRRGLLANIGNGNDFPDQQPHVRGRSAQIRSPPEARECCDCPPEGQFRDDRRRTCPASIELRSKGSLVRAIACSGPVQLNAVAESIVWASSAAPADVDLAAPRRCRARNCSTGDDFETPLADGTGRSCSTSGAIRVGARPTRRAHGAGSEVVPAGSKALAKATRCAVSGCRPPRASRPPRFAAGAIERGRADSVGDLMRLIGASA